VRPELVLAIQAAVRPPISTAGTKLVAAVLVAAPVIRGYVGSAGLGADFGAEVAVCAGVVGLRTTTDGVWGEGAALLPHAAIVSAAAAGHARLRRICSTSKRFSPIR
jgi:hypothetical protein